MPRKKKGGKSKPPASSSLPSDAMTSMALTSTSAMGVKHEEQVTSTSSPSLSRSSSIKNFLSSGAKAIMGLQSTSTQTVAVGEKHDEHVTEGSSPSISRRSSVKKIFRRSFSGRSSIMLQEDGGDTTPPLHSTSASTVEAELEGPGSASTSAPDNRNAVHTSPFITLPVKRMSSGLGATVFSPSAEERINASIPSPSRSESPELLWSTVPAEDRLWANAPTPKHYTVSEFINTINENKYQVPATEEDWKNMEIQEERMRQEAREEQMNVELEEERMRQEPHPGKNKKKKKKSKSKGKAKETMDATPTLGKNGGQENDPKGKGKADQNKEPVQIKEWEYQEPGVNKDGTTMSDEELEAQFASMDAFIREQSGIQNKPEPENVYPTIDLREPGYWDYMLPSRQHPSQTEGTEGPRVDSQACTTTDGISGGKTSNEAAAPSGTSKQ